MAEIQCMLLTLMRGLMSNTLNQGIKTYDSSRWNASCTVLKEQTWKHFVDTHPLLMESHLYLAYIVLYFTVSFLCVFYHCIMYVLLSGELNDDRPIFVYHERAQLLRNIICRRCAWPVCLYTVLRTKKLCIQPNIAGTCPIRIQGPDFRKIVKSS